MKTKNTILTTIAAAALVALTGCGDTPGDGDSSSRPAGPSAVKNSFAEVSAKLDPNGSLYLYYSTEDVIETVEKYTDALTNFAMETANSGVAGFRPGPQEEAMIDAGTKVGKAFYDQLGINEISGVGMSSFEFEKGLHRNKMVMHHYPDKSTGKLWSLFGSESHQIGMLKMLPANTALALSNEFNAKGLMEWLPELAKASGDEAIEAQFDQAMQMADMMIGLRDLAGSFGNQVGLFVTLDAENAIPLPPEIGGEIPTPGLGLVMKVKDDKIANMVLIALKTSPIPFEKQSIGGIEAHVLTEPAPTPFPLAPALFKLDDYIVAASNTELAAKIIASHKGDEGGLTSTEEFQRLAKGLDLKGNHFFFASEQIGKTIAPIIEAAMEANPLPTGFPNFDLETAANMQMLGMIRVEQDGFVVENHSSSGLVESLAMQAGVVPIAVGVGMLLPALANAKAKAQGISCMNNMKQIALALRFFADDHDGKLPWQVSENDGGSMEFIKPHSAKNALLDAQGKPIFDENSWRHFLAIYKYIQAGSVFICPTLGKTRSGTWNPSSSDDVSYWLMTDKKANLHNVKRPASSIILICPHHQDAFGAAFADGHCEIMKWPRTVERFAEQEPPIELPRFPPPNL